LPKKSIFFLKNYYPTILVVVVVVVLPCKLQCLQANVGGRWWG